MKSTKTKCFIIIHSKFTIPPAMHVKQKYIWYVFHLILFIWSVVLLSCNYTFCNFNILPYIVIIKKNCILFHIMSQIGIKNVSSQSDKKESPELELLIEPK